MIRWSLPISNFTVVSIVFLSMYSSSKLLSETGTTVIYVARDTIILSFPYGPVGGSDAPQN